MVEVAYQVAGENWKRRTFKSQEAFEKFADKMEAKYGNCVEYRFAN